MAILDTILINGDSINGPRAWNAGQDFNNIDEGISAADGSAIGDNVNANSSPVSSYIATAVNSDFGDMITYLFNVRYRVIGAQTNTRDLNIRVVKESDGTVLAAATSGGAYQTVANAITNTSFQNSDAVGFSYVNTGATKEDWDDMRIEFQEVVAKSKGGDTNGVEVDTAEFTGTYNVAVADVDYNATEEIISLSEPGASFQADKQYNAAEEIMVFSEPAATFDIGGIPVQHNATEESLVLVEPSATFQVDINFSATEEVITFSEPSASFALDLFVTEEILAISEPPATFHAESVYSAVVENIVLSEPVAVFQADKQYNAVEELIILGEPEALLEYSHNAVEEVLIFSEPIATFQIGSDVSFVAGVETIVLSEQTVNFTISGGNDDDFYVQFFLLKKNYYRRGINKKRF